jgi:hypothetical protein
VRSASVTTYDHSTPTKGVNRSSEFKSRMAAKWGEVERSLNCKSACWRYPHTVPWLVAFVQGHFYSLVIEKISRSGVQPSPRVGGKRGLTGKPSPQAENPRGTVPPPVLLFKYDDFKVQTIYSTGHSLSYLPPVCLLFSFLWFDCALEAL